MQGQIKTIAGNGKKRFINFGLSFLCFEGELVLDAKGSSPTGYLRVRGNAFGVDW
jgi:hypothetical protein